MKERLLGITLVYEGIDNLEVFIPRDAIERATLSEVGLSYISMRDGPFGEMPPAVTAYFSITINLATLYEMLSKREYKSTYRRVEGQEWIGADEATCHILSERALSEVRVHFGSELTLPISLPWEDDSSSLDGETTNALCSISEMFVSGMVTLEVREPGVLPQ